MESSTLRYRRAMAAAAPETYRQRLSLTSILQIRGMRYMFLRCQTRNSPRNFEIGRILHLRSEIRNMKLDYAQQELQVQLKISDFGSEMQDSSNFKFSFLSDCST